MVGPTILKDMGNVCRGLERFDALLSLGNLRLVAP